MKKSDQKDLRGTFSSILGHRAVLAAAKGIREGHSEPSLVQMLELGRSLKEACADNLAESRLRAEIQGYERVGIEVPPERRVVGFASPFPVRAIGLLDPEEIFLANREKFCQVTLTIGQAIAELEHAMQQIEHGGVLALKVPAAEVSGEAIIAAEDTQVFIYILPREIERVIAWSRRQALDALVNTLVEGALGPEVIEVPSLAPKATPTPENAN